MYFPTPVLADPHSTAPLMSRRQHCIKQQDENCIYQSTCAHMNMPQSGGDEIFQRFTLAHKISQCTILILGIPPEVPDLFLYFVVCTVKYLWKDCLGKVQPLWKDRFVIY